MELEIEYDGTRHPQVLFPIVFETEEHFIDFDTIVRCGRGVSETYRSAGIALFGNDHATELVFATHNPGSVVQWVGKKSMQAVFIGTAFAAQEFADGFLETATGKTFRDWGSYAAHRVASEVDELRDRLVSEITRQMIEAETCRRLLAVTEEELESILAERPEAAAAAHNGRRMFYEACRANERLPSVRFGTSPSAIRVVRNEFSNRAKRLTVDGSHTSRPLGGRWKTETVEIEVTSPNWDRLDQQRGWKGRVSSGKYIYFHISDTRFWRHLVEGQLRTDAPDRMVAQIIYEDVAGRYKNAEAVRILKFNSDLVSSELSNDVLEKKLAELRQAGNELQRPLFDGSD